MAPMKLRISGARQKANSVRMGLLAAVFALNFIVFLMMTFTLTASRHQEEQKVDAIIRNLALLLDNNVTASANRIDLTLREIVEDLQREFEAKGRLDDYRVTSTLARRQQQLEGLAEIRVTDADGIVRYGLGVTPGDGISYADRDFFMAQRARRDGGLIVSNLIFGRISRQWVIVFTRRYEYRDGSFAGMVSAAVPIKYFQQLLSGLDFGAHGGALLRDADTALIVRYPPIDNINEQPGAKKFSKELADIIASGVMAKTYHSVQTADGIERTNAYRRLSAVPFHLVAGLASEDYLADWRTSVRQALAFSALFLVVTSLAAWLLWRSFKLMQQASLRSELLLQQASDGVHVVDRNGTLLEASDAFYRMLGYSRDEILGTNIVRWEAKLSPVEIDKSLGRHFEMHGITTFETRYRCKSGAVLDVEVTGYPLDLNGDSVLYYSCRDISERLRIDEERRIAAVAFESREAMMVTDADGRIIRVNHSFTELTGYTASEVVGRTPRLLKSGRHDYDFYETMWGEALEKGFWQGEIWNRRKSGEIYAEWLTVTAVRDADGVITHFVSAATDITQRVEDEKAVRDLAFFDPLTGLANRRLLTERLSHAFAKSARGRNYGALFFIDLDGFKELNDRLGHAQGDRLLELVADRLVSHVRDGDTVARLGGDEFVVLLEDLHVDRNLAADMALEVANTLHAALKQPYRLQPSDPDWLCTSSIGIALFVGRDEEVATVMERADQALYSAKRAGRNTVRLPGKTD